MDLNYVFSFALDFFGYVKLLLFNCALNHKLWNPHCPPLTARLVVELKYQRIYLCFTTLKFVKERQHVVHTHCVTRSCQQVQELAIEL